MIENNDGTLSVFITEEAPNTAIETPLDRTMADGHTTLELYQALLPGQGAPDSIIDAHAEEAAFLGRDSDALIPAAFDPDAPIAKSIAACESFVWADPPDDTCNVNTMGNLRQAHNVSGQNVGLHVGRYWAYSTTANVSLGICNASSGAVYGRIGVDQGCDSSSAYSYWGWATLNPGVRWRWWNFRSVASGAPSCTPGYLCLILD